MEKNSSFQGRKVCQDCGRSYHPSNRQCPFCLRQNEIGKFLEANQRSVNGAQKSQKVITGRLNSFPLEGQHFFPPDPFPKPRE